MSVTSKLFPQGLFVLAVVGVIWLVWSQFGPGTTEGTQPRLRYVNISIAQPSGGSGLLVRADYAPPESIEKPGGGPVVVLSDRESDAYLVIDARTGEVLVDKFGPEQRAVVNDLIASVRVETRSAGPWPLGDVAPIGSRLTHGNIDYIQPDAGSGIFVLPGTGDGPNGSGTFLFVHNGRSRMTVDGTTGEINMDLVLPEDRDAFERLAASVTMGAAR